MKAILCGTGVDKSLGDRVSYKTIVTEYGEVEYGIKDGIILLPRHKRGHSVPPHMINYRANIMALSALGVDEVVALYAVGSITDKVPMYGYGILSDYMDFSGRNITFFSDRVKHTSVSHPFDSEISHLLKEALPEAEENTVYVCTNGPRFETGAEVKAYGILGGDVVGMTGGSEVTLLRELGIKVGSLVYSINWATGVKDTLSFPTDEEEKMMSERILSAALSVLETRK